MSVDVLFGQAYFLRFDPKLWEAQQPYAPLGALYAAAVARDRGWSVGLFDAMLATSVRDWEAALDRHRPRIAVLFEDSFNYLSKMCLSRMRDAAIEMIGAATARRITVVVAGSDATDHPSVYLDAGAVAVIAGEGEIALAHVLDTLGGRSATSLEQIDGLILKSAAGPPRRTPARAFIRDLDELPRPAWDLVDVEQYRAIWTKRHGYFSMNLATTRGCPYHCNWCAKPIYGQRYASRAVDRVVAEMAWLKATYRPDHLWIADDIFGLKPGWIEAFAQKVSEHNARIPFKCLLRADGVSEAIADALQKAGCQTVWIGAESGAQSILDAMEKGTTIADIERATRVLQARSIRVGFFLQFGYPGEGFDEVEATLRMVRRCRPDEIGVSVSYPLPGTTFFERVNAQLGRKQNWVDSDDLAMMYRGTFPPAFYRAVHALVHAEFRCRRGVDAIEALVARPTQMSRRQLRTIASGAVSAARWPWIRARVERLARHPLSQDGPFSEAGRSLAHSAADVR